CANPLTAHFGTTHGIAVGVMLPHVVRFNEAVCHNSYKELDASIANRVAAFLRAARLPQSLSELKVDRALFPQLATEAADQWTAQFNPRNVTAADLQGLYEAAW